MPPAPREPTTLSTRNDRIMAEKVIAVLGPARRSHHWATTVGLNTLTVPVASRKAPD